MFKEEDPPSQIQRIAVRGLLKTAGIPYESGKEGPQLPALLQRLKDLAGRAGGPPPLAEPPNVDHIDALLSLAGNQRFRAVANAHDRLSNDLTCWQAVDQRREKREAAWRSLERLLRHAEGLPIAARLSPTVSAIRDGRQLLDDPDPVAPSLAELVSELRTQVVWHAERLASEQRAAVAELEEWENWERVEPADRTVIVVETALRADKPPDVSTEAKLLEVLDATSLSAWHDRISLVPSRLDQAQHRVAKLLAPESVPVSAPSATIHTAAELDAYIDDLRSRVRSLLEAGKTVIL